MKQYQPKVITPEDIYRDSVLSNIDYSQVLDFRPPTIGEYFLTPIGNLLCAKWDGLLDTQPRFIVKETYDV